MNQNPYVFIVGCPRSGTTLLRRVVDANPCIAIIHRETHWIPGWYENRIGMTPEGFVTSEVISRLLEFPKFSRLGFVREELEALIGAGEPVSYATFITGVFNLYGKAKGKLLVGDKTPGYGRSIPTLHALWPRARFVHLIRDGRDVCLSAIDWKKKRHAREKRFPTHWEQDPVATAALWWESHVRPAREAGRSLGAELYYEIRYESLVANPARECDALCRFLGVPFDDAMVRFHEGRTKIDPLLNAKKAWRPITPGLRNWKTQLPVADVERFEALVGDLLDELGYERAVPCLELEAQSRAAMTRDFFAKNGPDKWKQDTHA